mgnify:CR=1 FL=1
MNFCHNFFLISEAIKDLSPIKNTPTLKFLDTIWILVLCFKDTFAAYRYLVLEIYRFTYTTQLTQN